MEVKDLYTVNCKTLKMIQRNRKISYTFRLKELILIVAILPKAIYRCNVGRPGTQQSIGLQRVRHD